MRPQDGNCVIWRLTKMIIIDWKGNHKSKKINVITISTSK